MSEEREVRGVGSQWCPDHHDVNSNITSNSVEEMEGLHLKVVSSMATAQLWNPRDELSYPYENGKDHEIISLFPSTKRYLS